MESIPNSLIDSLRHRAQTQPHRLAYRYLQDGECQEMSLTYGGLDRRARAIAALLQAHAKPGDRALLLLPSGLDFIAAYFGCLYAKVIAIPIPPPHHARLHKSLATLSRITQDATPAVALLESPLRDAISKHPDAQRQFHGIQLLNTDRPDLETLAPHWQAPLVSSDDIAFLQYTSGSTTSPKGVMVSHGNLIHNLGLIETAFGQHPDSETVIWLPPYHDMGLIGGILQPLYTGNPVTLLPHLIFLQRPLRWLQAISRYQATTSGGPNFAYELCVRKVKPEQRADLDLSSWEVAFNGAEPIRSETLDRFADYFAPCGFRREAFAPCYGLAEGTLMVSGGPKNAPVMGLQLSLDALAENRVEMGKGKVVVECGECLGGQSIRIVDPETLEACPTGMIGEVWVNGPSIARGYWNKEEISEATFGAQVNGEGDMRYLRTGDLGFVDEGRLYITGRIKNLIIVDGKNHYAHDIEQTVEAAHAAVLPAGCAAFAVDTGRGEGVVVMAEVQRGAMDESAAVKKAIRRAVSLHNELPLHDIYLSLPGSIPRTTSGKIRHFLCRQKYLSNILQETTTP